MPATTRAGRGTTATGMTTTSTIAMIDARQATASSCPDVGPGFHLHQRAERELGHADGRAGRAVVAEAARCRPRSCGRSRCRGACRNTVVFVTSASDAPSDGEQAVEVGDRLAQLALEAAADELAVGDADLAGHDEPVAGSHDRGVGTDGLGHGAQSVSASGRRSASRSGSRGGARRRPPRRRTRRRRRAPAGPSLGDDLDLDRWRVDGPQHAERPDREVVDDAGRRRPRCPRELTQDSAMWAAPVA